MIHINDRPKQLPPLPSTMCSRRHKGMIQTSVILVLIVCIGYGFYLYNLLQVKVKYLDTKALRHQSQQQSLSSQLQAVYEDRARLEKVVQKSKSELQKTKEEKESMIQSMLLEHQEKNQVLEKENKELKDKSKDLMAENKSLKSKHDRINKDYEELKEKFERALAEHESVTVELQGCRSEKEEVINRREVLENEIEDAKGKMTIIMDENAQAEIKLKSLENAEQLLSQRTREASQLQTQNEQYQKEADFAKAKYESLQRVLKAVPAIAFNFEHPALKTLDDNVKRLLLEHLGEVNAMDGIEHAAYEKNDVADADRRVPVLQQQLQGHPEERENLDPDKSHQDPNGHAEMPLQSHLEKEERLDRVKAQQEANLKSSTKPKEMNVGEQQNEDGKLNGVDLQGEAGLNKSNDQLNTQIRDLPQEESVKFDEGHRDSDNKDLEQNRLIRVEEIRAKEQEEAAKLELEKQKQQMVDDAGEEEDFKKLRENSKLQLQLAQDQQADMQKMMRPKRQGDEHGEPLEESHIDANIEDDKNLDGGYEDINDDDDEEGNNDNDNDKSDNRGDMEIDEGLAAEDSDDAQVAVPPAVQVAGHDPEAVMNPPPAKQDGIDSEEINGQDLYRERDDDENNDPVYGDDNQMEEGDDGADENENEENKVNQADPGIGEEDKVDDNLRDDDYPNEEEDPDEKKFREFRNFKRMMNDKNFMVRNDVQDMIPQEINVEKEM